MRQDFAVPPECTPRSGEARRDGVAYLAGRWDPDAIGALAGRIAERGARALATLGRERLLDAWGSVVEALLDPASSERRGLDPALAALCRLSPEGLAAGLEAVLGGVRRDAALRLLAGDEEGPTAETRTTAEARATADPRALEGAPAPSRARSGLSSPVLVILAGNLPGLAVQPLLPALLAGRPVILKSPSSEPLFAPALVAALTCREPALGEVVAALTWPGGDRELEAPLLAACDPVIAYGEAETVADLERRAPGRVVAYGPKTSLAVVGAGVDPAAVAPGLARDVALFDQRGCLSIAAVYTAGDAVRLARELARELALIARRLPPGPMDPALAAAVQQLRLEAELRGLEVPGLPLSAGTVIVEPGPAFLPSPGLRTVRVQPLADLAALPDYLAPWRGRLQGAALAGAGAWARAPRLVALGLSRLAPPGELQSPDATWHNGGVHPLAVLR